MITDACGGDSDGVLTPTLLIAATLLPATPQQSGAMPQADPSDLPRAEQRIDLMSLPGTLQDGVIAIADEEIISLFDFEQTYVSLLQQFGLSVDNQADANRVQMEALRRLLIQKLASQAGAELGLPEVAVATQAQLIEADRIDTEGVLEYGDSLRQRGLDPLMIRRRTKSDIYRSQWESFVTGNSRYSGGRPSVDSFIRPGELRAFYELRQDDLGTPSEITLQVVTFDANAWGNQEYATEGATGMLSELAAGAAWKDLATDYSSTFRESFGLRPAQTLAQISDLDLRRFAGAAKTGDVSEILPRRGDDGTLVGVQVARIVEQSDGVPAPPFDDPNLQNQLRNARSQSMQALLLDLAEERLLLDCYAWSAMSGAMDFSARP